MLTLITRPFALLLMSLALLAACDDTEAVDTDGDGDAEVVVEED